MQVPPAKPPCPSFLSVSECSSVWREFRTVRWSADCGSYRLSGRRTVRRTGIKLTNEPCHVTGCAPVFKQLPDGCLLHFMCYRWITTHSDAACLGLQGGVGGRSWVCCWGACDWRVKKWHGFDRSDDDLARLAAYCDNNYITSWIWTAFTLHC